MTKITVEFECNECADIEKLVKEIMKLNEIKLLCARKIVILPYD